MLDTLRIKRHLKELRKRLLELESKFKPLSEEELITDETCYNAAEHHLQIAIQNCLDIANHIVAALGLPSPKKEANEAFFTLAKERIISSKMAQVMKDIIGYRNVVIHEYLEVERHYTYKNIQAGLGDLAEFGRQIEKFLARKEKFDKSTSRM